MYKILQKLTFLLAVLLLIPNISRALEVSSDTATGDTLVVFRFMARNETFWASYKGNEKEFTRLARFIHNNREMIMNKTIPVNVNGYCSSFTDYESNRKIARLRSNHVKSFVIVTYGLREDHFKTVNHTTPYKGTMPDIVTIAFRVKIADLQSVIIPETLVEEEAEVEQVVTPAVAPVSTIAPLTPSNTLKGASIPPAPNANAVQPKSIEGGLVAPVVVNEGPRDKQVRVKKQKKEKVKKFKEPKIKKKKTAKTTKIAPIVVVGEGVMPVKVKAEKPVKVKAEKPVKVNAEKPVKVKAENPVKVKADKPVKVKAEKPVKVKAEKPVKVKAEKLVKVKAEKLVKVKAEKPVKVKADKPARKDKFIVGAAPGHSIVNKPLEYEITSDDITKKLKESNKKLVKDVNVAKSKPSKVLKAPAKKIEGYSTGRVFDYELKTNLLYWLVSSPNLEAEILYKQRFSINLEYQYAHTDFASGAKHFRLSSFSPEFRYYPIQGKLFVGAYYGTGMYNFKLSKFGYQGAYNGGGITLGYKMPISKVLGFEFSLSGGYAWTDFDKYRYEDGCNRFVMTNGKNYFGPTKAKVSLIWRIGGKK